VYSGTYSGRQVLLVDDDPEVVALLEFVLRRYGQEPISAHDARTALQLFRQRQPDLVLLDIILGTSNGLQVLKEIRQLDAAVPVIMLTAMDDTQDKVRGLQMGADDFITKPFNNQELMARIEVQFRRADRKESPQPPLPLLLKAGPLVLDDRKHSVTKNGKPIDLTLKEFDLLRCLMRRAGSVVPYRTLLQEVWNDPSPGERDEAVVVRVTVLVCVKSSRMTHGSQRWCGSSRVSE
jgi:DNA-binding response OmpR family regulator